MEEAVVGDVSKCLDHQPHEIHIKDIEETYSNHNTRDANSRYKACQTKIIGNHSACYSNLLNSPENDQRK